jgi:hypothetical protein
MRVQHGQPCQQRPFLFRPQLRSTWLVYADNLLMNAESVASISHVTNQPRPNGGVGGCDS